MHTVFLCVYIYAYTYIHIFIYTHTFTEIHIYKVDRNTLGRFSFYKQGTFSKTLKTARLNIVMVKGNKYDLCVTKTWTQSGECPTLCVMVSVSQLTHIVSLHTSSTVLSTYTYHLWSSSENSSELLPFQHHFTDKETEAQSSCYSCP